MRLLASSLLVAVLLLAACTQTVVPPPRTADFYLQEGEGFFDKGLYEEAISSWQKVRDTYYSPELNVLAELKIAEAHYLAENYLEAATAYEDFLKQHPEHEKTPEVLYLLAMSYYNQILSSDRDQTATRNALVTFERFLKRYPGDPKKEEVEVLASRCRDLLAEHEVYVGRFYLRTGRYPAAISRLKGVFALYPNYYERDKAYFYLGQAYLKNGDKPQAISAFNTLFKEFPRSEYIIQAQKIVEKHY
jgi:outer membrane protein assembly factor BamD